MAGLMDLEWRQITHDDVPAWNALLAAAEAVDATGEHYNEHDLHEELDDPDVGAEDRAAAWSEGEMVGYAATRPRGGVTYLRIHAEGTVHPAHRGRGIGQQGIGWIERRVAALQAQQAAGQECRVEVVGCLDNDDQVALLEGAGYRPVNWSATMRVRLGNGRPVAPPPHWPAGYTLHTFSLDRSTATLQAHNAAFTDHWGFTPWTPTMWRQFEEDSRNARHPMSWLLIPDEAPDLVAGYLLTHEYDAYQQATGSREAYVAKLGVRREHRGRGLASGLLRRALASYAAAGYDEAALDVDTNNPTGAFGLYERTGFEIEQRTATYQRTVPAVGAAAS